MLLLAAAVMATGCGNKWDYTPPGATQPPVTLTAPSEHMEFELVVGKSLTVEFTCSDNSAIDAVSDLEGATITRVGTCGIAFSAVKPGVYNVTVTAIRDRSKNLTVRFTVLKPSGWLIGGDKPAELAGFSPQGGSVSGLWADRAPGTYDPTIDTLNVEDRAYVYSAFDAFFNPLTVPAAIAGYQKVTVADDDYSVLKAGEWAEYSYASIFGDMTYLIIVPRFTPPAELAGFSPQGGSISGLWADRAPGTYDPTIDALNVEDRAYVYSAFDAFFSPLTVPAAIAGYQKVAVADDDYSVLKAGEWAEYSYASIFGDMTYLVIVPNDFVP